MTMESIPDLAFEIDGDQINLEQDAGLGDVDRVTLHRIHLLHLAKRVGLVRELSASDAADSIAFGEMVRDLDRLKRNMLRVREHALRFQDDFRRNADWDHADLTHEMNQINTLVDLLDMAVDDFSDDYEGRAPAPYVPSDTHPSEEAEGGHRAPHAEQGRLL